LIKALIETHRGGGATPGRSTDVVRAGFPARRSTPGGGGAGSRPAEKTGAGANMPIPGQHSQPIGDRPGEKAPQSGGGGGTVWYSARGDDGGKTLNSTVFFPNRDPIVFFFSLCWGVGGWGGGEPRDGKTSSWSCCRGADGRKKWDRPGLASRTRLSHSGRGQFRTPPKRGGPPGGPPPRPGFFRLGGTNSGGRREVQGTGGQRWGGTAGPDIGRAAQPAEGGEN